MQDGRIAYMYESVLKERFPSKVIEFYEQQMRNRTACWVIWLFYLQSYLVLFTSIWP